MSNETFAAHLGIGVRTVADWHQKPGMRPRPEMQQILDAALARAPAAAGERFAVLTGEPAHAKSARQDEDAATADTEHRLITDHNISGALNRLDQLAAWEPGTARRKVAARLVSLDRRDLLDRASRRSRIGQRGIADALGQYYRCQARRARPVLRTLRVRRPRDRDQRSDVSRLAGPRLSADRRP